jgi:RHS repeat-associated protein
MVRGLTNGTSYTFTVTATTAVGTSASSRPSSPVTPAAIPGKPTGVRAVPGADRATVSWAPPASNGGSPVTRYAVVASPGGRNAVVPGTVTQATVTGLAIGRTYTFTVTPANSVGVGATSAASSPVRLGAGQRPPTPTRPGTRAPDTPRAPAATCSTQPMTSKVAAGPFVSAAVKPDGTVWAWGDEFEVGPNGTAPNLWPVQVTGLGSVTSVAAGESHLLALRSDGTVWAWGSNFSGQLGNGTTTDSVAPVQVSGLTGVVQVVGSGVQSLALRSDGTLWEWGSSADGSVSSSVPVQVQSQLTGQVVTVAQSYGHTLVVECDGTVWSWGSNAFGQLGNGSTTDSSTPVQVSGLSSVIAVAAGSGTTDLGGGHAQGFSLALKSDGSLWAWGYNGDGELGNGATTNSSAPVAVTGLSGVTAISAFGMSLDFNPGLSAVMALKSDGTVWTWGGSDHGQLGQGSTASASLPAQVAGQVGVQSIAMGIEHAVVLRSDGTNWAWGGDAFYQLGNGVQVDSPLPVEVDPLAPQGPGCATKPVLHKTAVGLSATYTVQPDGTVWGWGDNNDSQLGPDAPITTPRKVQIPSLTGATSLVAGRGGQAVVLKSDGTVWAWGLNGSHQLGDGTSADRPTPVQVSGLTGVVEISTDEGVSTALKSDGTLWTWGNSFFADPMEKPSPVQMFPMLTGVVAEATGQDHVLAVRCDGSVWAWGSNVTGQLGNGVADGTPNNTLTDRTPQRVRNLSGVNQVAASDAQNDVGFSLALKPDGTVWAWGDNSAGQLGNGTTTSSPIPVQTTGLGEMTALATEAFNDPNAAGTTVAVKSDGTVWSWGDNAAGQLGNDTTAKSTSPVQAIGLSGATEVAEGEFDAVARKSDGAVWDWGDNSAFQLGDGTKIESDVPEQAGVPRRGLGPLVGLLAAEMLGLAPIDVIDTSCHCADPVDPATGNFSETYADLRIPGRGLGLTFTRTYNSLAAAQAGPLGPGWTDNFVGSMSFDASGNPTVREENGSTISFSRSGSSYTAPSHVLASLTGNSDGTFTLKRRDQTRLTYSASGQLQSIADRNGFVNTLTYSAGSLSAVTDPAGRQLTFAYEGSGRLSGVTDVAGSRSVAFAYDSSGNLSDVKDVGGGTTHFTYDSSHRLLTITDPRGGVTTNVYDGSGRVTSQTDRMQRQTAFDYSVANQTKVTYPNGNATLLEYQNNALVRRTDGFGSAQPSITSYSYDPAVLGITTIIDPNLQTTTQAWDASGNQLTRTDPLGHQTTYSYDSLNDVTAVTDPLNVNTSSTYDANGNLTSTSTPLTGGSSSRTTSYSYDPAKPGDLVQMTDPNGKQWHYTYDVAGDRVSLTDPMGNKTTYAFDAIGRLTSTASARGNAMGGTPSAFTTSYQYDAFGDRTLITDPLGHQTQSFYDGNRNLVKVIDANQNTTLNMYDADDELTQVQRADGTVVKTGYDGNGNVTSQTDGLGQTTMYGYDAMDRKASMTDPLNRTTSYAYNGNGNLTGLTDAMGRVTARTYDNANQLTGIGYSDGITPNVGFNYDADGQRTSMTDGTGTTTYVFDSLHRLTSSTNGAGAQVGYGYDLKGQLTSITYPGGTNAVSRTYDDAGRLASVTDWLSHQTTFGYDANSNLTQETYPNGTQAVRTYDNADQLSSIVDSRGSTPFLSLSYTRDAVNQLKSENNLGYGYDPINRLTGDGPRTYAYDGADRLTQVAVDGGNTSTLTYDTADQVQSLTVTKGGSQVSKLTYGYDGNGNRTSQTDQNGVTKGLGYDQANRLRGFGSGATYAYNGDGLRMSKTVGGTTTQQTWDVAEGLPLLLQDGATAYVTGPGGLPIEQVSGGTVSYFHQDQLDSIRAVTDGTGNVTTTLTYDAYGNLSASTGSVIPVLRYAGQYFDAESSFYYMRSRLFDPASAQFIAEDPMVDVTRQPYAYVGDSPLNSKDPSGLDDQSAQPFDAGGLLKWFSDMVGGYVRSSEVLSSAAGRALSTGGSAAAGRALATCDRLTPFARIAGRFAPGIGLALTYGAAKEEGASDNLALARAIGGTVGGVIGVELGAGTCGVEAVATSGFGALACPALVIGLGVGGGAAGEFAGNLVAGWMHW